LVEGRQPRELDEAPSELNKISSESNDNFDVQYGSSTAEIWGKIQSALFQSPEYDPADDNEQSARENHPLIRAFPPRYEETLDYRITVPRALLTKDPDLLLRSMVQAAADRDYIHSIPGPTFTQILTLLDPDYFVVPLREIHQKISMETEEWLGLLPIKRIMNSFSYALESIITGRLRTAELTLTDYKLRLKCAYSVGAHGMAKKIWDDMKRAGATPDTQCFNYLLGSLVYNRQFLPESRQRLRNIPFFMKWRQLRSTYRLAESTVKNHYKPSQSYAIGEHGIQVKANDIFRQMLHAECVPNEETFCLLIQAYGKEGRLGGIWKILNNVWNVPEAIPPDYTGVKEYPKDSPLYPSDNLLTSLALVFGTNNDIPRAMQLVDHISRGYGLQIPSKVWELFLNWTFVLSKNRGGATAKNPGVRLGQLKPATIDQLWRTMTSPPYNITPTIPMYDYRIRSLENRFASSGGRMKRAILEAAPQLAKHREALLLANLELDKALELAERSKYPYGVQARQRKVDELDLLRRRNAKMIRNWIMRFSRRTFMPRHVNMMPQMVRELQWCMPDNIFYTIVGVGDIHFSTRPPSPRLTDEERQDYYRLQAEKAKRHIRKKLESEELEDPILEETARRFV
jgi:hypothetical protein